MNNQVNTAMLLRCSIYDADTGGESCRKHNMIFHIPLLFNVEKLGYLILRFVLTRRLIKND